jgi:hypothetical protein
MIRLKNVPHKARYESLRAYSNPRSERAAIANRLKDEFPEAQFHIDVGILDLEFDPAFLRFQWIMAAQEVHIVYCFEILREIWADGVAGQTLEQAEEDLCLLIDSYPEGRRPLFD